MMKQIFRQNRLLITVIIVMLIPLIGVVWVRSTIPSLEEIQAKAEADIAAHTETIAQDPDDVAAYISRCASYARAEQFSSAIADGDQAVALSPTSGNAWLNRGLVQEQMGDYAGAIADYEQLLSLAEESGEGGANMPASRLRQIRTNIGFLKTELARQK